MFSIMTIEGDIMSRNLRWMQYHTLRNQMLFGFLLVMIFVLSIVALTTFQSVSRLLKDNAKINIQDTAIQASGRLESMLKQIDMLSTQVATDGYVQQLLLKEHEGFRTTFGERQKLSPIIHRMRLYANGIKSVELYSYEGRKMFPLDGNSLQERMDADSIVQAVESRGSLVWFGVDPNDRDAILAIRLVKLIDSNFAPGGFLLVRMNRDFLELGNLQHDAEGEYELMVLDADRQWITSSLAISQEDAAELIDNDSTGTIRMKGQQWMVVKQTSAATGWALYILTPVSRITEGISVLRTAIVIPALLGFALYSLLSLFLSTVITKPIMQLRRTMRVTRLGTLKRAENVFTTIEIQELYRTYNAMVEDINNLIQLVYEKEILQSRAELKALQAQVNPHFLFNTMEALYRSLNQRGESELAEFVITLSEFFRYTITRNQRDEWVTLEEEFSHIEKYLHIMRKRLGERLAWEIDLPEPLALIPIPKLLVQPIVENAIVHGIEEKIGQGKVTITAGRSTKGDGIVIEVCDDGIGMNENTLAALTDSMHDGDVTSAKGTGFGIANVERRLRLSYRYPPGANCVEIESREGAGTRVRITIPQERRET